MLRHTLVAGIATVALLAPAAGADAVTTAAGHDRARAGITGTWKGGVYGDSGGSAGYPAKVRIFKRNGTLHGRISYPGSCSGKWVFRGKHAGWFRFREVITRGSARCVSPVSVKTKRVDRRLKVVWREPQTGDTGYMLAHRV
jgi:hypothetical protein